MRQTINVKIKRRQQNNKDGKNRPSREDSTGEWGGRDNRRSEQIRAWPTSSVTIYKPETQSQHPTERNWDSALTDLDQDSTHQEPSDDTAVLFRHLHHLFHSNSRITPVANSCTGGKETCVHALQRRQSRHAQHLLTDSSRAGLRVTSGVFSNPDLPHVPLPTALYGRERTFLRCAAHHITEVEEFTPRGDVFSQQRKRARRERRQKATREPAARAPRVGKSEREEPVSSGGPETTTPPKCGTWTEQQGFTKSSTEKVRHKTADAITFERKLQRGAGAATEPEGYSAGSGRKSHISPVT